MFQLTFVVEFSNNYHLAELSLAENGDFGTTGPAQGKQHLLYIMLIIVSK